MMAFITQVALWDLCVCITEQQVYSKSAFSDSISELLFIISDKVYSMP